MSDMGSREPRLPKMAPQAGTWTKRKQRRKGCCGGYASQTKMFSCASLRSPRKKGAQGSLRRNYFLAVGLKGSDTARN